MKIKRNAMYIVNSGEKDVDVFENVKTRINKSWESNVRKLIREKLRNLILEKSNKKNREDEYWEKDLKVSTFNKKRKKQQKMNTDSFNARRGCFFYEMTETGSRQVEWNILSKEHKKAFSEVIQTITVKSEVQSASDNYADIFSFVYSDLNIDYTVICIADKHKMMFFFKQNI